METTKALHLPDRSDRPEEIFCERLARVLERHDVGVDHAKRILDYARMTWAEVRGCQAPSPILHQEKQRDEGAAWVTEAAAAHSRIPPEPKSSKPERKTPPQRTIQKRRRALTMRGKPRVYRETRPRDGAPKEEGGKQSREHPGSDAGDGLHRRHHREPETGGCMKPADCDDYDDAPDPGDVGGPPAVPGRFSLFPSPNAPQQAAQQPARPRASGLAVPAWGDSDVESFGEPLEVFDMHPSQPTASPSGIVCASGATNGASSSFSSPSSSPSEASPPPQQQSVPAAGPTKLDLSVRLFYPDTLQPVSWGSVVANGSVLGLALGNPSPSDTVRVVCHVCDRSERRLPLLEGSNLVADIAPNQGLAINRFKALAQCGPLKIHLLASQLPLVSGRPLYHTRLFVNVQ